MEVVKYVQLLFYLNLNIQGKRLLFIIFLISYGAGYISYYLWGRGVISGSGPLNEP